MQRVASNFWNNHVKTRPVVGEKMLGFEEGQINGRDQTEKTSNETTEELSTEG